MSKVEIVNLFSHLHENQTNKKTTENKNGYAQIKSNSKLFFLFIKKNKKKTMKFAVVIFEHIQIFFKLHISKRPNSNWTIILWQTVK